MKKYFILFLFGCIALCGCEKEVNTEEKLPPAVENEKLEIYGVSNGVIDIPRYAGKKSFTIESNTDWIISVNYGNIDGLSVYPVNGNGTKAITIEYDKVSTNYYEYSYYAYLRIEYYSNGVKQYKNISLRRRSS